MAVIAEAESAAKFADLMTAQLSSNDKVQLLERDQIQKVVHEQALSAGMNDAVKMGRILGADGLLLLNAVSNTVVPKDTNTLTRPFIVTARLIAVKPGVLLASDSFPLAPSEMVDWASQFAPRLNAFLPKLAVLEKDAVPISIVNLRSAVQTDEGRETERQVKALAMQRLSQEQRVFVLERQSMELLGEEKDLSSDKTEFWNGSYLLEGVLDENGYSKDAITLHARIIPPRGGAAVSFELSGPRTNLSEIINGMALKLVKTLEVQSTVKSWSASDEAKQYLDEANWAMRWQVCREAQMAAEAAWALGKRDLEGALARVKSYVIAVPEDSPEVSYNYAKGKMTVETHYLKRPDPKDIRAALYALKCYEQFTKNSPEGEPKVLWRGKGWNDWHDSDWYKIGIDALTAASRVLQHYSFYPKSQIPVQDELAELRAVARTVAGLIANAPSVHDSYFVGDRLAIYDELASTMDAQPTIFRCETDWGCFWFEKPDDTLALYRKLMDSPVFCYVHQGLLARPPGRPRLVAWNAEDRARIPVLWSAFVEELKNSKNVYWNLEAAAFNVADSDGYQKSAAAISNLVDVFEANRHALVTNTVDIFYLQWHAEGIVPDDHVVTPERALLESNFKRFCSTVDSMSAEFRSATVPAAQRMETTKSPSHLSKFDEQRNYLSANTPFEFRTFSKLFLGGYFDFSKAQIEELLTLMASYKSNLEAQGANHMAIANVGIAEKHLKQFLNTIAIRDQPPAQPKIQSPPAGPKNIAAAPQKAMPVEVEPETITNVESVNSFVPIPLNAAFENSSYRPVITAHHWISGKMVLDLECVVDASTYDTNGYVIKAANARVPFVASYDPGVKRWDVAVLPRIDPITSTPYYHRTTIWNGQIIHSGSGKILQYDAKDKRWREFEISDGNDYELFCLGAHLYAANGSAIFEITENGRRTKLMASARRHPAVTLLDSEDLAKSTLMPGPNESLRVITGNRIFSWTGADWSKELDLAAFETAPEITSDAAYFITTWGQNPSRLFRVPNDGGPVELLLQQKTQMSGMIIGPRPKKEAAPEPLPKWKLPSGITLGCAALASHQDDLYLMTDHCEIKQSNGQRPRNLVVAKNGCHTELFCFASDAPTARKVYLKFGLDGIPPVALNYGDPFRPHSPAWMVFAGDYLVMGQEYSSVWSAGYLSSESGSQQLGIWLMPISQLQKAVSREKPSQQAND